MITEDYVSFEIAKLLKEKGFDAECHSHYYPCHYPDGSIQYHKYEKTESTKNKSWYDIYSLKNLPKDHYLAPTLQMAMKWMREVHNIQIVVSPYNTLDKTWSYHTFRNFEALTQHFYAFETYEEAAEAAIKYCLENLI